MLKNKTSESIRMKTSRFIVLVLFIIGLLLQSGLGQAQSNIAQTASAVGQVQDTVETDLAEVAQAEAMKTN